MSPIRVTAIAAVSGKSYSNIRIGECNVHQCLVDVSTLGAAGGNHIDAGGSIPPGIVLNRATGGAITANDQVAFVVGPEPLPLGLPITTVDFFGNVLLDGNLNKMAIEDNIG